MRVEQLVQVEGTVLTIVKLRPGDVYKRLERQTYGDQNYVAYYGVVQTIDSNGEDKLITAIEFKPSGYGKVEMKVVTYGTENDLRLFAVTVEEVQAHFTSLQEEANKAVDTAQRELHARRAEQAAVDEVLARAEVGNIQAAHTRPVITG